MNTQEVDVHRPLELRRALMVARRRWWLIALCALTVTVAAYAFSKSQEQMYTASASLLLHDSGLDQVLLTTPLAQPVVDPTREAETNIAVVSSPAIARLTAAALHIPVSTVVNDVTVTAQGQTNVVSVQATDASPRFAALLANEYASQAIVFRRQTDRTQVLQIQRALASQLAGMTAAARSTSFGRLLQSRRQELQLLADGQTGSAEVIQSAAPPAAPSLPRTKRNVILGLVFGLLLGVGAALLAERLSRRMREPDEFRDIYGLPVLTEIPKIHGRKRQKARAPLLLNEREAFRMLVARLRHTNPDPDAHTRSVLVTSSGALEGKSTVAWHLAETVALTGTQRVLLVEADMRAPVMASRHGLRPTPGLREVLDYGIPFHDVVQTVPLSDDGPIGPGAPRRPISLITNGSSIDGSDRSDQNAPHQPVTTDRYVTLPHRYVTLPVRQGVGIAEPAMDVIVAGTQPHDPTTLIESQAMADLLDQFAQHYDLILVDTVPALVVADAMPLMTMVDAVLVVGRAGLTTRDQASTLRNELRMLNVQPLGVIVNEVRAGSGRRYGHYPQAAPDGATVRPVQQSVPVARPAHDSVAYRRFSRSGGSPGRPRR